MFSEENIINDGKKDVVARGKRLRFVRQMANKTLAEMKEYGISDETMANWERARGGGLTEKGAKRIVSIFKELGVHFSLSWLLSGTGRPPISFDKDINSHFEQHVNDDKEKIGLKEVPEEIKAFCEKHPEAIYFRVSDDGMNPQYRIGDYVAGKRYYQNAIQEHAIGKICIVETEAGEKLLRLIREGKQEGRYSLFCTNPAANNLSSPYDETELVSAAPVYICVSPQDQISSI